VPTQCRGLGFDGDYLFAEANRRMLAEDRPERRERDRETVDAWYRAQGIDKTQEIEGAKEKLLAKLEVTALSGKPTRSIELNGP
jgi:hypothetical protein